MPIDLQRVEQLKRVVEERGVPFLSDARVTSVGVALLPGSDDTLCIRFTVEREGERAGIPAELELSDGSTVPTHVMRRRFYAGSADGAAPAVDRKGRVSPIQPGISISHRDQMRGTLGAIVYRAGTSTPFVASCHHVLHGARGQRGEPIVQPGVGAGGASRRTVATLRGGILDPDGDFAIAEVSREIAVEPTLLELGVVPQSSREPGLGERVVKSGAETAITHGVVDCVGMVVPMPYGSSGTHRLRCFEVAPLPADDPNHTPEISLPGDSGALWMAANGAAATPVAVGMHFAGELEAGPAGEYALAFLLATPMEIFSLSFSPGAREEAPEDRASDRRQPGEPWLPEVESIRDRLRFGAQPGIESIQDDRAPIIRPVFVSLPEHPPLWGTGWIKEHWYVALALVALVATTTWAIRLTLGSLPPETPLFLESLPRWKLVTGEIVSVLAALGFLALLAERLLELIMGLTRRPHSERQRLALHRLAEYRTDLARWIAGGEPTLEDREDLSAATRMHESVEVKLQTYRLNTRTIALSVSAILGLLLALTGLRVLGPVVMVAGVTPPAPGSLGGAFEIFDILLTAAVLAAGSDGAHRLTEAVTGVLSAAQRAGKAAG